VTLGWGVSTSYACRSMLGPCILFARSTADSEQAWLAANQSSATGLITWGSEETDSGGGGGTTHPVGPIFFGEREWEAPIDVNEFYDLELQSRVQIQIDSSALQWDPNAYRVSIMEEVDQKIEQANATQIQNVLDGIQWYLSHGPVAMSYPARQKAWMDVEAMQASR
jgi:hypothetical protein